MRVLFDKNVPYGVRHFLGKHQVETIDDYGWARIANGELLKRAEAAGLDVVGTADQNVVYQQNLKARRIALLVLGSNIWPIVRNYEAAIRDHVDAATPGSYAFLPCRSQRSAVELSCSYTGLYCYCFAFAKIRVRSRTERSQRLAQMVRSAFISEDQR